MLVIGYRITYMSRGLIYYIGVEGMDLDEVPLDNVEGSIVDTYAGVRWNIRSERLALQVGYRRYDADLRIRDDKLIIKMDGVTVSLFISW
jgi:hypothetical protein